MIKSWTSKWLVALGCLAVFSMVMAAEPAPSGTVKLTSKAVAVGIGVTWGDGTLTFGGKPYAFSVDGLSVADLGVSDVTTSGEVFNLKNVADFSGNYAAGESGCCRRRGRKRHDHEEREGRRASPARHAEGRPADAWPGRRDDQAQELARLCGIDAGSPASIHSIARRMPNAFNARK